MQKNIIVEALSEEWSQGKFDLGIVAVGYERRFRYIVETYQPSCLHLAGVAFPKQQVLEFNKNVEWFTQSYGAPDVVSDDDFGHWISNHLARLDVSSPSVDETLTILVDISSLNRVRIAKLVASLAEWSSKRRIEVSFLYALASFTEPSLEQHANTHVGPVTIEFAGWWNEPERVLSAVVGLGYEQDKALGAVEYLQAQDVWLFQPESEEIDYTAVVNSANGALLKGVEARKRFVYKLHDPLSCFSQLNALVQGLTVKNNVVLLPFGPKLFVLCALLAAISNDQVAVWRVSAQAEEEPINRSASGHCYGLRVVFMPNDYTDGVTAQTD